jgi:hypothetical protein
MYADNMSTVREAKAELAKVESLVATNQPCTSIIVSNSDDDGKERSSVFT